MDRDELQNILTYSIWLRLRRQIFIHYMTMPHPTIVIYPEGEYHWIGN